MEPKSWILALRERLASPPQRRLAAVDLRPASVLVPLYVDAGELWTWRRSPQATIRTRSQLRRMDGARTSRTPARRRSR